MAEEAQNQTPIPSLHKERFQHPAISVICVTNRQGAVSFLLGQLAKQTFQDYEVIVADDSENAPRVTTWDCFTPRQKAEGDVWNLNKAYNDCLDKVTGELIVFVQDFILLPANGLERFWELFQLYPKDLITGCGHKYRDGQIVEVDDRCFGDRSLVPSDWTYYELNWASCPTSVAPRFEEDMDKYYGGENQVFALKSGRPVWLDRTNECKGQEHTDRPDNWEPMHSNKLNRLNNKIKQLHGVF